MLLTKLALYEEITKLTLIKHSIMKRSCLKNRANKTNDPLDHQLYKKQRNYVVNLNKQAKRSFFSKTVSSSKSFWNQTKPFFSNKGGTKEEKIFLLEGENLVTEDNDVANTLNKYFVNIAASLPITPWMPLTFSENDRSEQDPIDKIIYKFKSHPSIVQICKDRTSKNTFSFTHICPLETYQVIMGLNQKKSTSGPISTKTLKIAAKVICTPLTDCFNVAISDGVFPDELKLANVVPVFKKGDSTVKANYRPISILPSLSKVLEKILFNRMSSFFEGVLSKFLCGFRKSYSTQHALLNLLKHWQESLDKKDIVGTVLMDLSKAFDSLPHDLLLAKLAAYGFDKTSLRLLNCYLSNRKQRTKIGSSFSSWLEIILGVPQGSILGPLLFNIFINDLLSVIQKTRICNFADDNTIYSFASSTEAVISNLKYDLIHVLSWFSSNELVANPNKFQLMLLGTDKTDTQMNVNGFIIDQSDSVKLLGVTLDKNLSFQSHISDLCTRASRSIRCLRRVRNYLDFWQALSLYNCYIQSYFNYCPLIWMFCNKTSYNMIDNVQKRALRALYNVYDLSLDELLNIDGNAKIHTINIRCLLIEIFKTIHGINPEFMREIFITKTVPYNLRDPELLVLPETNTIRYGVNSLTFRSGILWNSLPKNYKKLTSLNLFKNSLKSCTSFKCSCQLCKI